MENKSGRGLKSGCTFYTDRRTQAWMMHEGWVETKGWMKTKGWVELKTQTQINLFDQIKTFTFIGHGGF